MNTPQPHYGFNAKPVAPVDVSGLQKALWGTHTKLEDLYRSFGRRSLNRAPTAVSS
jgi:hypothetical protein